MFKVSGSGITAQMNGNTLNLTGPASVDDFSAVFYGLFYENTHASPTISVREITFTVSDGSATSVIASTFVDVVPVNDMPVMDIDGPGTSNTFRATFVEGSSGVRVVSPSLAISDFDSSVLSHATAQLSGFDGSAEKLAVQLPSGSSLSSVYTISSSLLSVTGAAAIAEYETVLRSLQYVNTADEPTSGLRTVSLTVNDGTNNSLPVNSFVTIRLVNDPPQLTIATTHPFRAVFNEGGDSVAVAEPTAVEISDPDSPWLSELVVRLVNILNGSLESVLFTDPVGGTPLSNFLSNHVCQKY